MSASTDQVRKQAQVYRELASVVAAHVYSDTTSLEREVVELEAARLERLAYELEDTARAIDDADFHRSLYQGTAWPPGNGDPGAIR